MQSRELAIVVCFVLALCISACGAKQTGPKKSPAEWVELADRYMTAKSWREAGNAYVYAFRLIDPVPSALQERALLAFRAGMSFGREARHTDPKLAFTYARAASFWLTHTLRLQPKMRQALYERALLYETKLEGIENVDHAKRDYKAYVEATEALGDELPESERGRVNHARERLVALGR